jgi:hypothetical protein
MTTRGKHLGGIRTLDDLKARTAEVGDCWEWQCGYQNHGKTPAVVYIDKRMSGRRLALMLAKPGQKLDGKVVIAKCGNHKCVNPDHMLALTKEPHHGRDCAGRPVDARHVPRRGAGPWYFGCVSDGVSAWSPPHAGSQPVGRAHAQATRSIKALRKQFGGMIVG